MSSYGRPSLIVDLANCAQLRPRLSRGVAIPVPRSVLDLDLEKDKDFIQSWMVTLLEFLSLTDFTKKCIHDVSTTSLAPISRALQNDCNYCARERTWARAIEQGKTSASGRASLSHIAPPWAHLSTAFCFEAAASAFVVAVGEPEANAWQRFE